jgi:hypothetical protein
VFETPNGSLLLLCPLSHTLCEITQQKCMWKLVLVHRFISADYSGISVFQTSDGGLLSHASHPMVALQAKKCLFLYWCKCPLSFSGFVHRTQHIITPPSSGRSPFMGLQPSGVLHPKWMVSTASGRNHPSRLLWHPQRTPPQLQHFPRSWIKSLEGA